METLQDVKSVQSQQQRLQNNVNDVFIVNFELVSHLILLFLKLIWADKWGKYIHEKMKSNIWHFFSIICEKFQK